ncbi:MAG: PHP domain-containing protein [Candidatus Tectomicrobia bacterium]|uniref:PHP domain-containing protein n=1 Tax=Tectimicrobiota bacterium TaxID=2528274 RepID=A0A933GMT0_UNCTE|nr:PHP domain-containing protein [Candidatus Tectomicrobia bacterium]
MTISCPLQVTTEEHRIELPFMKVDFHVHTPVSKCYSISGVTYKEVVEAAVKANLQAMAITDHNACEGCAYVKEFAHNNGLVIFPGVELSTKEGHVLGLFDVGTSLETIEDLLESVGISKEARGDGTVMTKSSIEEVFFEIDQRSGLAIAAHIERWPSGFLETKEDRKTKISIHSSKYLSALEITQPQNKGLWSQGKMRNYPKKYPCLQGSDAHSLVDIGRRPTLIKLDHIDLNNLRKAFQEPDLLIKFPQELE